MANIIKKYIFCTIFIAMITLPLLNVNLVPNSVSYSENRVLAQMPELYDEDGNKNIDFINEFEVWFNDNIGFREKMIFCNAFIQCNVFNKLPNDNTFTLGPKGELNYIGEQVIPQYQHLNLLSEDELNEIANGYQVVNDYLSEKGIQFYYMQNWDEPSIYPEYFPNTIIQYGDISMTDQVVDKLRSSTNIKVVSTKETMINAKQQYETYSVWGDTTHWTQRGAYLGYLQLMDAINKENQNRFRVLQESDYTIRITDQGSTMYGGIHKKNMSEDFMINEPSAVVTNEKITLYKDADSRQSYYTNNNIDNDTKVLILGDSYIQAFIMDDLAESFNETIQLWSYTISDITSLVDEYRPDIIIFEKAQRQPEYKYVVEAAKKIENIK